jgi:hypothetical protein
MQTVLGHEFYPGEDSEWECRYEGYRGIFMMSVFEDTDSRWKWELQYLYQEYDYSSSWEPLRDCRAEGFDNEADALFDAARAVERHLIIEEEDQQYWENLYYESMRDEQIEMILRGE